MKRLLAGSLLFLFLFAASPAVPARAGEVQVPIAPDVTVTVEAPEGSPWADYAAIAAAVAAALGTVGEILRRRRKAARESDSEA